MVPDRPDYRTVIVRQPISRRYAHGMSLHRRAAAAVTVAVLATLAACSSAPSDAEVCDQATIKLGEIAALQTSADDPSDATMFNEEVTRRTTELRALKSSGEVELVITDVADAYDLFTALTVERAAGGDVASELDAAGDDVEAATQRFVDACARTGP